MNDVAFTRGLEKDLHEYNNKICKLVEKIDVKEGWIVYFQHVEKNVLIPELNLGQLDILIRSQFLINTKRYNVVAGKPFSSNEIFSITTIGWLGYFLKKLSNFFDFD